LRQHGTGVDVFADIKPVKQPELQLFDRCNDSLAAGGYSAGTGIPVSRVRTATQCKQHRRNKGSYDWFIYHFH